MHRIPFVSPPSVADDKPTLLTNKNTGKKEDPPFLFFLFQFSKKESANYSRFSLLLWDARLNGSGGGDRRSCAKNRAAAFRGVINQRAQMF